MMMFVTALLHHTPVTLVFAYQSYANTTVMHTSGPHGASL